jgi:endonuclease/exonuclease/phosphatase family metal-dependent hydrolase
VRNSADRSPARRASRFGTGCGLADNFAQLFLLLSIASCEAELAPIEVKVASINLRHDSDCWEERFELIGDEVAALSADLIGMQEVEIAVEQAELLQQNAREDGLEYAFHQELKTGLAALGGEGIALFSRHPIAVRPAGDHRSDRSRCGAGGRRAHVREHAPAQPRR